MVLGLRTNSRKNPSFQANFLICVSEIKPWPPSQSLRSLRSVILQWENRERSSGSTIPVIPSLGSGTGDGKIEFNESFKISVTLSRDYSIKGGDRDAFRKNCLVFNLYETRRDKTIKGQLLGTAIINLADFGLLKEDLTINVPMNCKRSFNNTSQPILFINIQSIRKGQSSSVQKEALHDKDRGPAHALIDEKYTEEAELASFTDDDVSSHSSITVASSSVGSPSQFGENGSNTPKDGTGRINNQEMDSKTWFESSNVMPILDKGPEEMNLNSTHSSVVDLSSAEASVSNDHPCSPDSADYGLTVLPQDHISHDTQSCPLSRMEEGVDESLKSLLKHNNGEYLTQEAHIDVSIDRTEIRSNAEQDKSSISTNFTKESFADSNFHVVESLCSARIDDSVASAMNDELSSSQNIAALLEVASKSNIDCGLLDEKDMSGEEDEHEGQCFDRKSKFVGNDPLHRFSQDVSRKNISSTSDTVYFSHRNLRMGSIILNTDKLKHVKSVRSPLDSGRNEAKVDGAHSGSQSVSRNSIKYETTDENIHLREKKVKVQQLEHKIKMLEGELTEAASAEVSLHAVVADHGSSMCKVHAPARRLSRLYLYNCKEMSQTQRRASAARSAVSGLTLAAKACGNDVPRLTFWLSNSVMLRVIISQAIEKQQDLPSSTEGNSKKSSTLKWKENTDKSFSEWEDPQTFIRALEETEAWIFSRVIESIWWQTLTPYMQSTSAKAVDGDSSLSLKLWKKAFKDACDRICPVRGGGHECGCLSVLVTLIMEQCIGRLDVAMFNAILRENSDDIPTDPVSDPITDSLVLPISVAKSSFGAGVRLKNVIGNWSRTLTNLFGIDEDDEKDDRNFKSFRLLSALSDLMMLPKDMLLNRSIRSEVCPYFGALLIKKILNNFVPDEFCPDPIPEAVLSDLDIEECEEMGEKKVIRDLPWSAGPVLYTPPSVEDIEIVTGNRRYDLLSDDEASILIDDAPNPREECERYQLLRKVWMNE